MSGLRPQPLIEFYRSLRARGQTTETLAAQLSVSGSTVRKLIGCLRLRRGGTWRRLLGLLQPAEIEHLRTVEQYSTWNKRQQAKRPKWTSEKVAGLFETYQHSRLADERDRLREKESQP